MPVNNRKNSGAQTGNSRLQDWLRDNGHTAIYGEWLQYCIDNNDSATTLAMYVQDNYPEVWRQYNGS